MRSIKFSAQAALLGALSILAAGYSVKAEEPITTASITAAKTGSVTGLAIPRYVSLKPSDTPMREGPGKNHAIKWIFKKEGLPVEITAEFENWRRVRDFEGSEGWVYHSRLSGRRTVMVQAKIKSAIALYKADSSESPILVRLEPGVVSILDHCNGKWCKTHGEGFDGYIEQDKLWGVYPKEIVK